MFTHIPVTKGNIVDQIETIRIGSVVGINDNTTFNLGIDVNFPIRDSRFGRLIPNVVIIQVVEFVSTKRRGRGWRDKSLSTVRVHNCLLPQKYIAKNDTRRLTL